MMKQTLNIKYEKVGNIVLSSYFSFPLVDTKMVDKKISEKLRVEQETTEYSIAVAEFTR